MSKVTIGEIEVEAVHVLPGLIVVSALAHPLVFEDGEELAPNPGLAKLVKAALAETAIGKAGEAILVTSVAEPDPFTMGLLNQFFQSYMGTPIRVVTSILGVTAYREKFPGLVISSITTPETSRLDNAFKRVYRNKWNA